MICLIHVIQGAYERYIPLLGNRSEALITVPKHFADS